MDFADCIDPDDMQGWSEALQAENPDPANSDPKA